MIEVNNNNFDDTSRESGMTTEKAREWFKLTCMGHILPNALYDLHLSIKAPNEILITGRELQ